MPNILRVRRAVVGSIATALLTSRYAAAEPKHPSSAWYLEAKRMRELAESWGDQSYGAVVVIGNAVVGHGPSRVVKDHDLNAHAERVAIRAAQVWQGSPQLAGAVLYSTSRPCSVCEQAAAQAGIQRMYYGENLHDAGSPKLR